MTRFDHVMRTAAVYAVTLFLVAPPAAQGKELASTPPARSHARHLPETSRRPRSRTMKFLSAAIDHFRYLNFEQSAGSAQRGASDTS
jgi:hypothetical protein